MTTYKFSAAVFTPSVPVDSGDAPGEWEAWSDSRASTRTKEEAPPMNLEAALVPRVGTRDLW